MMLDSAWRTAGFRIGTTWFMISLKENLVSTWTITEFNYTHLKFCTELKFFLFEFCLNIFLQKGKKFLYQDSDFCYEDI